MTASLKIDDIYDNFVEHVRALVELPGEAATLPGVEREHVTHQRVVDRMFEGLDRDVGVARSLTRRLKKSIL